MTLLKKQYLLLSIYTRLKMKEHKAKMWNSEECVFYFAGQILFNNMIFCPLLDKCWNIFSLLQKEPTFTLIALFVEPPGKNKIQNIINQKLSNFKIMKQNIK